jgi:hypothetical protein
VHELRCRYGFCIFGSLDVGKLRDLSRRNVRGDNVDDVLFDVQCWDISVELWLCFVCQLRCWHLLGADRGDHIPVLYQV